MARISFQTTYYYFFQHQILSLKRSSEIRAFPVSDDLFSLSATMPNQLSVFGFGSKKFNTIAKIAHKPTPAKLNVPT